MMYPRVLAFLAMTVLCGKTQNNRFAQCFSCRLLAQKKRYHVFEHFINSGD